MHRDMSLYEPPQKKAPPTVTINVRIPLPLREQLEAVARLWRLMAHVRGDEEAKIDLSYVTRRLFRAGVAQAFAEFGQKSIPSSEEEWSELERVVSEALKAPPKAPPVKSPGRRHA